MTFDLEAPFYARAMRCARIAARRREVSCADAAEPASKGALT